jgi:tetratricopeptide (TPR) repeat protein
VLLKGDRLIGFGILSFFVLLLPVTLIPLPDMIFEHRVYPAFAGIAIAVAALCRTERKALLAGVAVILVVLSWRTVVRNSQWNDDITFMELHRARFPQDPDILARLGSYYYVHGQVNKALEVTLEARKHEEQLNPYYSQARKTNIATNLVAMYFARQDLDSALKEARRAIALDPEQPMALRAVATVEMSSGHYAAARDAWQKLTEIRPEDSDAWFGLKEACRLLGDVDGMTAADHHFHDLLPNTAPASATPQRPIDMSAAEKTYVIFSLTVGVLFLLVLAGRTVWFAVNQQKFRIKPVEGRPSS